MLQSLQIRLETNETIGTPPFFGGFNLAIFSREKFNLMFMYEKGKLIVEATIEVW